MRRLPFLMLLLAALAATLAFAACGDDDGGGGGDRLTEEAYFARLTEIDDEVDARFDSDIFTAESETAQDIIENFKAVLGDGVSQVEDLNPPETLQADHDDLLDKLHDAQDDLDAAGADFSDDDLPEDVEERLFLSEDSPIIDSFMAVDAKFCELQTIADEKGIEADVGCEDAAE